MEALVDPAPVYFENPEPAETLLTYHWYERSEVLVLPDNVKPEASQHSVSVVGVPFPSVNETTVCPLAQNDKAMKRMAICFQLKLKGCWLFASFSNE